MTWWWLLRQWLRHPVSRYGRRWKSRHVPRPGDRVEDCRYKLLRVTAVDGDDLLLEDGTRASWMHCCNWP